MATGVAAKKWCLEAESNHRHEDFQSLCISIQSSVKLLHIPLIKGLYHLVPSVYSGLKRSQIVAKYKFRSQYVAKTSGWVLNIGGIGTAPICNRMYLSMHKLGGFGS